MKKVVVLLSMVLIVCCAAGVFALPEEKVDFKLTAQAMEQLFGGEMPMEGVFISVAPNILRPVATDEKGEAVLSFATELRSVEIVVAPIPEGFVAIDPAAAPSDKKVSKKIQLDPANPIIDTPVKFAFARKLIPEPQKK